MKVKWGARLLVLVVVGLAGEVLAGEPSRESREPRIRFRRSPDSEKNSPAMKAAFREPAARASAATVRILCGGQPAALGAVVGAQGQILTKASVLKGTVTCRLDAERELPAKVVRTDEDNDLALLQVEANGLSVVPWRTGGPPPPGSLVVATAPGGEPLALGVISAAPHKIGNFGGPRGNQGWLGITVGNDESGTGIADVSPKSPAEKAGLKAGDQILRIADAAVASMDDVVDNIRKHAPGEAVKLVVRRDGKEIELSATLGKPSDARQPQDHWGGGPFSDRRDRFPSVIPHDTIVRPQDCGGPLVDTDGNVVGINIARALRVSTYAIPADAARRFAEPEQRESK
jgi:serine protease Do